MKRALFLAASLTLGFGCGSPSAAPGTGVDLPPRQGTCPRGFGVVSSDYSSSSIAVLSQDGTVLSGSILSSAAIATGASAALTGDVALARAAGDGGRLFAIDRYPNAVVTAVTLATANVAAQRSVATGFASNPYDLLPLGDGRIYLARYGTNPKVGREPWDGGSDLLVLDEATLAIRGRIDLGAAGAGFPARPSRLLRVGELVVALLGRIDAAFTTAGDGAIAVIDPKTDTLAAAIELPGVANCGAFALSQDGTKLAVACTGVFAAGATQLDRSDLVLVDATARPLAVLERRAIAKPLAAPLASAVAFDGERILGLAFGAGSRGDVVWMSSAGEPPRVLATSQKPFSFGDVVCSVCSGTCLFTDAERGAVRRLKWNGKGYDELPETRIPGASGLPPRTFGGL